MTLTDPIHPNEKREAIEAEHMLEAERDAREYMSRHIAAVENVMSVLAQRRSWRAVLLDEETAIVDSGAWGSSRSSAMQEAVELFDDMEARKAKEIYEREYKNV
jgi:hypothetical protein